MDSGVAGYSAVNLSISNPIPDSSLPKTVAGFQGYMALQDNTDPDAFNKIFEPINDTINCRWSGKAQLRSSVTEYRSFLEFIKANYYHDEVGDNRYLVSRLLGMDAFQNEKALGEALVSGSKSFGGLDFCLVGGKGVQEAKPFGGSNSVNSAWRSAYVHASKCAYMQPINTKSTLRGSMN